MVRRSARQQNLSQDMMTETINQANHCFSISSQTKYTQQQSTNADIIISPEMANAVICPETGKSLKHQGRQTKSTDFSTQTQSNSYIGRMSLKDVKSRMAHL
jgi:hypothetical protein